MRASVLTPSRVRTRQTARWSPEWPPCASPQEAKAPGRGEIYLTDRPSLHRHRGGLHKSQSWGPVRSPACNRSGKGPGMRGGDTDQQARAGQRLREGLSSIYQGFFKSIQETTLGSNQDTTFKLSAFLASWLGLKVSRFCLVPMDYAGDHPSDCPWCGPRTLCP